jgi:hypothetical protein
MEKAIQPTKIFEGVIVLKISPFLLIMCRVILLPALPGCEPVFGWNWPDFPQRLGRIGVAWLL